MDANDLYLIGVVAAFSLFALVLGVISNWSNAGPKA